MAHQIKNSFKLALAQLNPVVGDLAGNTKKAREVRARVAAARADLVVFTELYLTGYPLEDMVLKPALQKAAREACEGSPATPQMVDPRFCIGLPWGDAPFVYNAVALLDRGRIEACATRTTSRIMACSTRSACSRPGPMPAPIDLRGVQAGRADLRGHLERGGVRRLSPRAARVCSSCRTARPIGWTSRRCATASPRRASPRRGLPLVYVNQVGGQDELVFDGASFVLNGDCTLAVQMPAWEEVIAITEWRRESGTLALRSGRDRRGRGG